MARVSFLSTLQDGDRALKSAELKAGVEQCTAVGCIADECVPLGHAGCIRLT